MQEGRGDNTLTLMSQNQNTIPSKGILKKPNGPAPNKTTAPNPGPSRKSATVAKFDEQNITETFHPEGKDYGNQKIDEPKTPYEYEDGAGPSKGEQKGAVDPNALAKLLEEKGKETPKALTSQKKEEEFENKRKQHYDEWKRTKKEGPPKDFDD